MKRLTSVEELQSLRERAQKQAAEREKKIQVKVHLGTCGIASGASPSGAITMNHFRNVEIVAQIGALFG